MKRHDAISRSAPRSIGYVKRDGFEGPRECVVIVRERASKVAFERRESSRASGRSLVKRLAVPEEDLARHGHVGGAVEIRVEDLDRGQQA